MPSVKKSSQVPLYPAIRFNIEKSERELLDFSRQALIRASGDRGDGRLFYVRRQHVLASIAQTEIILRHIFS